MTQKDRIRLDPDPDPHHCCKSYLVFVLSVVLVVVAGVRVLGLQLGPGGLVPREVLGVGTGPRSRVVDRRRHYLLDKGFKFK